MSKHITKGVVISGRRYIQSSLYPARTVPVLGGHVTQKSTKMGIFEAKLVFSENTIGKNAKFGLECTKEICF